MWEREYTFVRGNYLHRCSQDEFTIVTFLTRIVRDHNKELGLYVGGIGGYGEHEFISAVSRYGMRIEKSL
jgi:hypothetical protein